VNDYDIVLARYNIDGSLDTSFGAGGKVIMNVEGSDDYASSVAIQPDGKIVLFGSSLIRFNADGSPDTSFGVNGIATTRGGADAALQADGKIVTVGTTQSPAAPAFTVARYLGDAPANAEISVSGSGVSIPDGGTTLSTADGTDFGSVSQYEAGISRVFTVRNDGASTLVVGQ